MSLAAYPVIGLWEQRGWSASGKVQTTSAILSPRHLETISGTITFSGIAYAGNRAITNVEISIDDGDWMPVPFRQENAGHWAQWSMDWTPYTSGDYGVSVRATDDRGFTQRGNSPIFPNGSSSIHNIIVRAIG